MNKLLPCPFCGDIAELDTQRGFRAMNGDLGTAVAIYCTACQADMTLCRADMPSDMTTEDLVSRLTEMWNRRSQTVLKAG